MTVVQDIGNQAICKQLWQLNIFQSTGLLLILSPVPLPRDQQCECSPSHASQNGLSWQNPGGKCFKYIQRGRMPWVQPCCYYFSGYSMMQGALDTCLNSCTWGKKKSDNTNIYKRKTAGGREGTTHVWFKKSPCWELTSYLHLTTCCWTPFGKIIG